MASKVPKIGVGLFVNRLHWTVSGACLRKYFERFGGVLFAEVQIDWKTGLHKGYGWVRMSNDKEVQNALEQERHTIEGYEVSVRRDRRDGPQLNSADPSGQEFAMDLASSSLPNPSHVTATDALNTQTTPPADLRL